MTLITIAGSLFCGTGAVLLNLIPAPIIKLSGLFLCYLGGSVLLLNVCSFQMCAALFVCGIGVTVLLGTSLRGNFDVLRNSSRTNLLFNSILVLMCAILAYTASAFLSGWIPVRRTVLLIVLWNTIMCLFRLSLDDFLLSRFIYLQTICLSFTITYMFMESSVLVFAFFSVINLFLAFGGSVLSMRIIEDQTESDS